MREIDIASNTELIEIINRLLSDGKIVELKDNSKRGLICVGISEKRKVEYSEKK